MTTDAAPFTTTDFDTSTDFDALTGDLQGALAALADVEFGFQIACERLDASSGAETDKTRCRTDLEAERARCREPLLRRLDELDRRVRSLLPLNAASGGVFDRPFARSFAG
ncbi:hypothetical protein [Methylobacterium nigriterrae]|uniref:hypothetical protein n=1 Tax=Methylobacterium nigriterrae TaxID=3127512 RepID=UPI00301333D0